MPLDGSDLAESALAPARALAETIGMAAASGAARAAESMSPLHGFLVILAGGLVEGTALGTLQAASLRSILGRRSAVWGCSEAGTR